MVTAYSQVNHQIPTVHRGGGAVQYFGDTGVKTSCVVDITGPELLTRLPYVATRSFAIAYIAFDYLYPKLNNQ